MRPSSNRHVLARLRQILGLNQTDFAKIADCSPSTIQAIELGRLRMSESLATKIQLFTGVSHVWLLNNDLKVEPYGGGNLRTYNKEVFERVQAARLAEFHPKMLNAESLIYYARMKAIFSAAMKVGLTEYRLANFKFNAVLDEFEKEFGCDESVYSSPAGNSGWDGAKAIKIAKEDIKEAEKSGQELGLRWVYYGNRAVDATESQTAQKAGDSKQIDKTPPRRKKRPMPGN